MTTTDSAGPLADHLLTEPTFSRLIDDSHDLVKTELKKKNIALRTGFGVIQKAKPDLVDRSLRTLMPQFVNALEPFHARAQETGTPLSVYLKTHDTAVADALLQVSDKRVEDVDNRVIKSGYQRLRGRAHKEVVAAVPGLADVMGRHAPT